MPRGAGPPRATSASRFRDRCCLSGHWEAGSRRSRSCEREPSATDAIRSCDELSRTELHRFIEAARSLARDIALDPLWLPASADDPLWATPHDLRFDFEATAAGAEWIDDLAHLANERRRRDDGEDVIGHVDWRVQNLAFEGTRVVAIYDWDSARARIRARHRRPGRGRLSDRLASRPSRPAADAR